MTTPMQTLAELRDRLARDDGDPAQTAAKLDALTEAMAALRAAGHQDAQACESCGAVATLLCDHYLGFQVAAEPLPDGRPAPDGKRPGFTCDAPMCAACAHHAGLVFWHGSRGGGADSRDYCLVHAGGTGGSLAALTKHQADRERADVLATLRRRRIQPLPDTTGTT